MLGQQEQFEGEKIQVIDLDPNLVLNEDESKQQYLKHFEKLKEIKETIIARKKENRTEMIRRGLLNQFIEFLNWARNQKVKEYARNIQTQTCDAISIVMSDNPEAIELAINNEFILQLKMLLNQDIPLEEVNAIHISSVKSLCTFGNPENRQELFNLGMQQAIIRNLKSKNPKVTLYTAASIYKIISSEWYLSGNKCLHPQFEVLEHDGVINALFEDGIKEGNDEETKFFCADCLGLLYQKRELPEIMKKEVIKKY
ncbi:MAG: hypothetical protein EZS28_025277 [Streblomastix strix]|uniref:Uncharacterized protein n=1 Tax=Streblomastix strix TaxID=222440 RepID=A0A5J4V9L4_9EUKA|nr:MAG: hypothetical protein EZS28_025276 [Streblomastix strix]KAA6379197.1 MAG: hypothetical protein EZS28_025277 [Streblomastix strix]